MLIMTDNSSSSLRHLEKNHKIDKNGQRQRLIPSLSGMTLKPRFRRFICMLSILLQYLLFPQNARESLAAPRSLFRRKETGWQWTSSRHPSA